MATAARVVAVACTGVVVPAPAPAPVVDVVARDAVVVVVAGRAVVEVTGAVGAWASAGNEQARLQANSPLPNTTTARPRLRGFSR
ncbi:MAG: hypothetical protein M3450_08890 [Actinomycetota bacterium]|nr:hypothetical protein [Actinomycetota bacterium]